MKINNTINNMQFKGRCADIRLGQDICRAVNKNFPCFSLTKHKPYFDSGYKRKVITPTNIMSKIINLNDIRPILYDNSETYTDELIEFADKYKTYNCFESAYLSAVALKLNCIDNPVVSEIQKGAVDVDHIVCVFNRDGSTFNGDINNNNTIIIDAWAGLCDFANNLLPAYDYILNDCKNKKLTGRFKLLPFCKVDLSDKKIEELTAKHFSLIV